MVKRIALVAWLMVGVSQSGIQTGVPVDPSVVGYLNLAKRHPDGSAGPTEFATEFAAAPALQRLDQMRGFLSSFKQLTMKARGKVSAADLRSAGNTSGEMQSIGFHNIPLVLEGTLLKQEYQLRQVQYELAQLRLARGEMTEQDVERARSAYAEATRRFQLFWDTKRPVD